MVKRLWLLLLLLAVAFLGCQGDFIPVTGIEVGYDGIPSNPESALQLSSSQPVEQIAPQPLQIVGISSPGAFSYSIVEQPQGNAGYVSYDPGSLTKFHLAEKYGTIGLLAHNFLAGQHFFQISIGDDLILEMNDGSSQEYRVFSIKRYQALDPYSPYSDFIDLSDNEQVTASELFTRTYGSSGKLILQTCIKQNGVDAWGRLFIIAEPVTNNKRTADLSGMMKYGLAYR